MKRKHIPKTLPNDIRPKCLVCGSENADRAHIRTRGAGASWEPHEYMYLCRKHHTEQGSLNWARFAEKYPVVFIELRKKGWAIVEEFGILKIRRINFYRHIE